MASVGLQRNKCGSTLVHQAPWAVQRFSAMIVDVPQVIFMLRRYTHPDNYRFVSDLKYDDYGRCDKGTFIDSRTRSIMNVIKRDGEG